MNEVIVVVGAGQIGQAIARRIGAGKHVLLASLKQEEADAAAKAFFNAGFQSRAASVDVSSRESVGALVAKARQLGAITGLIHAAGVSPSQAPIEAILRVDLYGTALVLELSGPRGAGYRRMIDGSPVGRAGTPDQVGRPLKPDIPFTNINEVSK